MCENRDGVVRTSTMSTRRSYERCWNEGRLLCPYKESCVRTEVALLEPQLCVQGGHKRDERCWNEGRLLCPYNKSCVRTEVELLEPHNYVYKEVIREMRDAGMKVGYSASMFNKSCVRTEVEL